MPHRQFVLNTVRLRDQNIPMYLHSAITEEAEGTVLRVYRSPIVRDGDPMYQPVRDYLALTPHEVLWRGRVPDPEMMFGEAEVTVYMIERKVEESDDGSPGGPRGGEVLYSTAQERVAV